MNAKRGGVVEWAESKIGTWWLLCASEIFRIDAIETVMIAECKKLDPDLVNKRKLYRQMIAFFDLFELDRAAHEKIMIARKRLPAPSSFLDGDGSPSQP